jgi:cbb3-type cytochrome oxidase subunit 1
VARNLAFLALAVVIGIVVYFALQLLLTRIFSSDHRTLPLILGGAITIAAFVAGAQFGRRLKAPTVTPWALALGSVLSVLFAAPSVAFYPSNPIGLIFEPGAILIVLVFVSAFLGVRATGRPSTAAGSTDA